MQDERRHSPSDGTQPHTCGTCASHGEEVHEDWMLPTEHYFDCPTARTAIGMVEAEDVWGCWEKENNELKGLKEMKILELFSGTEHLSEAFRQREHEAFTVDWDEKFPSSLHIDIEQLTADMVLEQFGRPDVIWMGTDCTTYSVAAIGHHRKRNKENGNLEPQTPYATKCDNMNQHCLRLIAELKPKVFIIENPRAGLRSMVWMKGIPRYTTTYCQYGFKYMKPTDFWSNVDLRLKAPCKNGDPCHERAPRGTRQGLQGIKGKMLRSVYPPQLIEHFVNICEEYVNDGQPHPLPEVMISEKKHYRPIQLTLFDEWN